ncbi:membrane transport protein [Salmonella enterica subsp. arizonae]|uniref:Membrane transport protein n=1 Tax=Salmonella enterica subsp. arizonae TaxID=59203 RepID=A0A3S4K5R7_SALER|nr:membrane transport protein [Salmonella enterica subsp. arizonae]
MLLRSALGMAIVMLLMGMAQNIWQFLILRALLGLLGGFIPNANALIATQVPRHKSGWALGRSLLAASAALCLAHLRVVCSPTIYGLRRSFYYRQRFVYLFSAHLLFYSREFPAGEQKKRCFTFGKWSPR